ncbi:hypothetical protein [Enterobacter sp. C4G1]|uniref:hypothetical protein n=1 Tax=Enterobacter sp. C4G1 TaxID=3458724 RepID=UPI0040696F81
MRKIPAAFLSAIACVVTFASISGAWFNGVPIEWIYAISDVLGTFGDESTLEIVLMSSWVVALLPSILAALLVYRILMRKRRATN